MYFIDSEKKLIQELLNPYHPFVTPPFLGIQGSIRSPLYKPGLNEAALNKP